MENTDDQVITNKDDMSNQRNANLSTYPELTVSSAATFRLLQEAVLEVSKCFHPAVFKTQHLR